MSIGKKPNEKLAESQVRLLRNASENNESKSLGIVPSFAIGFEEARQRVVMLQEFVKTMMVQGQDYGLIPGCNKPSLFKPGAEKLCDIFGFSKQVEIMNRAEEWDKPFLHYEVKVTLTNKRTGLLEAEGIGSCNSMERKYASQNTFTICNTLIKMAKKRALVDAVLSATRSSGIFTQDIEDLDLTPQPYAPAVTQTCSSAQSSSPSITVVNSTFPITPNQLKKIIVLVKQLGMPTETVKKLMLNRYQVENSQQLTKQNASDLIQHLMTMLG